MGEASVDIPAAITSVLNSLAGQEGDGEYGTLIMAIPIKVASGAPSVAFKVGAVECIIEPPQAEEQPQALPVAVSLDGLHVAVDFDGVIHQHAHQFPFNPVPSGAPVPGAIEFLKFLVREGANFFIHSARASTEEGADAIADWLRKHGAPVPLITNEKRPAHIYIDDNAVRFRGDFQLLLQEMFDAVRQ